MKGLIAIILACMMLISVSVAIGAEELETPATVTVTVNGQSVTAKEGDTLSSICAKAEKQFLFAKVADETVLDPDFAMEEGLRVEIAAIGMRMRENAEIRRVLPSGVRFLTEINTADLAFVQVLPNVKSIGAGTLIRPFADLSGEEPIHPADEVPFLEIPADLAHPYQTESNAVVIAGSIVDVKPQNHSRLFAGRGYLTLTMEDGTAVTRYAAGEAPTGAYGALAAELLKDEESDLTDLARGFFENVATVMYRNDLQSLGVLAIGDSLFDGDFLKGNQQWIALLARACEWDYTNLGRDGWTVAYNPEAYADPTKVRNSMYDKLFHDPDYAYGKVGSYSYGSPYGKDPEHVDLILLEGGTNDYGHGIPLGEVDSRDGGTLLGSWNLMIEKLLADYPNATVVLVTSWHIVGTRSSDGASRMDFVADGMKAIYEAHYAENERVRLIDGGNPAVTGIDMSYDLFRYKYSKSVKDVNHLNAEGMKMMADAMLPLLWETLCGVR